MKIVLRVVGSLFIAVGLFWFAQGNRIAPRVAQCCNDRLRRGRRSLRYRPCLVRMAVGARAHLGSRRRALAVRARRMVKKLASFEGEKIDMAPVALRRAGAF